MGRWRAAVAIACLLCISEAAQAAQFDPTGDVEALRQWCTSTPSPFLAAGVTINNVIMRRGFAMATCYMLMKRGDGRARYWSGSSLACATHPDLPPGVVDHLAVVPAPWVAERLLAAAGITTADVTCPWVGLRHGAGGWYHEPHDDAELQRWQLAADDVPTPWDSGQPAGSFAACLQVSTMRLRNNGDGYKRWICEYHYEPSPPASAGRFRKVPGASGRRPSNLCAVSTLSPCPTACRCAPPIVTATGSP